MPCFAWAAAHTSIQRRRAPREIGAPVICCSVHTVPWLHVARMVSCQSWPGMQYDGDYSESFKSRTPRTRSKSICLVCRGSTVGGVAEKIITS